MDELCKFLANRLEPIPQTSKDSQRWSKTGLWEWVPDENGQRCSDWKWVPSPLDGNFSNNVLRELRELCWQVDSARPMETSIWERFVESYAGLTGETLSSFMWNLNPMAVCLATKYALGN